MDGNVWLEALIGKQWEDYVFAEHRGPLGMYVDNFKSHVSDASLEAFAALNTEIVSSAKNNRNFAAAWSKSWACSTRNCVPVH